MLTLLADEVLGVRQTYRVCCIIAYAVASSVGKNSGLDLLICRTIHGFRSFTLTAMMYAIVKKDVSPARTSVVNFVCRISSFCEDSQPYPMSPIPSLSIHAHSRRDEISFRRLTGRCTH